MKIYVIIITYNAMPWIDKCLLSLRSSTIPLHTLVIDNTSADETVDHIRKNFPEIRLIENKRNLGFGKANNTGLKIALKENADFVLLMNQDAWIFPDTVDHLVKTATNHPDYFILSPLYLQKNEKSFELHFAKYISSRYCPDLVSDLILNRDALKPVYPIRYIHAALWFLSGKCISVVGGFDPVFPHRGEDNDYLNRVKYHGGKVGICPVAKAVHDNQIQGAINHNYSFRKNVNKFYVSLLHQQKDITKNFFSAILNSHYYFIRIVLWNLFHFKIKSQAEILIAYLKYLVKIPNLIGRRKKCTHKFPIFLQ